MPLRDSVVIAISIRRSEAEKAELAHAIVGTEVLRNRMAASCSPVSHELVAGLNAALRALGRD
jgi:hypothetical protein